MIARIRAYLRASKADRATKRAIREAAIEQAMAAYRLRRSAAEKEMKRRLDALDIRSNR